MKVIISILFTLCFSTLTAQYTVVDSASFNVLNFISPTFCNDDTIYVDLNLDHIYDFYVYKRTPSGTCTPISFNLNTLGNTELFHSNIICLSNGIPKVNWGDTLDSYRILHNNNIVANWRATSNGQSNFYSDVPLRFCQLSHCGGWSQTDTGYFEVRTDSTHNYLIQFSLLNKTCFSIKSGSSILTGIDQPKRNNDIFQFNQTNLIYSSSEIIESINIYTLSGRLINRLLINANEVKADLSSLDKGLYFARIKTSSGVSTHKFYKN